MTLGEKLIALRRRKGYSQTDFCEAFNKRYPQLAINRAQYSRWELMDRSLQVKHLKALVTFYRVSADDLLFDHRCPALLRGEKQLEKAQNL